MNKNCKEIRGRAITTITTLNGGGMPMRYETYFRASGSGYSYRWLYVTRENRKESWWSTSMTLATEAEAARAALRDAQEDCVIKDGIWHAFGKEIDLASHITDEVIRLMPEHLRDLGHSDYFTRLIKKGKRPISEFCDHNVLVTRTFKHVLNFDPCETGGVTGVDCSQSGGCMSNVLWEVWEKVMEELVKRGYKL